MEFCSSNSESQKNENVVFDFSTMPRCQAKASRTGERCRRAAVKGQMYCGIHSGRYKPGPQVYNKPRLIHGFNTKEAQQERAEARRLINRANDLITSIADFSFNSNK